MILHHTFSLIERASSGVLSARIVEFGRRERFIPLEDTSREIIETWDHGSVRMIARNCCLHYEHREDRLVADPSQVIFRQDAKGVTVDMAAWPDRPAAQIARAGVEMGELTGISVEALVEHTEIDPQRVQHIKRGVIIGAALVREPAYDYATLRSAAWQPAPVAPRRKLYLVS